MAKQVKIKDIAKMAGVSAGTVDRILHNRGNVSPASRSAVEKVLNQVGYRYNIHTSAVSLKKTYHIVVSIPTPESGEYWGSILHGIDHAINEYSDISIRCSYCVYNQFDIYSCRTAYAKILDTKPDAVIIGPTFTNETLELCGSLDEAKVPYVFVDAVIEGASPVATFTTDQHACGFLLGKLLDSITPEGTDMAILRTQRVGNQSANNSVLRKKGFEDYFSSFAPQVRIHESYFSMTNPDENEESILRFIDEHPEVKGIGVLNSRGFIAADVLYKHRKKSVKMVTFDMTSNNIRCIRNRSIDSLLCQRPEMQGFLSVRALIRYLLYNIREADVHHYMPIDIIMLENIDYYRDYTGM
ncbi:MAG: substrate-binding domain-containing protein [Bacteroidales bacterium]|nr:substrate-binding domain-containing protein [Bacteroidales bacterium]